MFVPNMGVLIFLTGCVKSKEQAPQQHHQYVGILHGSVWCNAQPWVLISHVLQNGYHPIHYAAASGQVLVIHLLVNKYHVDSNTPTTVVSLKYSSLKFSLPIVWKVLCISADILIMHGYSVNYICFRKGIIPFTLLLYMEDLMLSGVWSQSTELILLPKQWQVISGIHACIVCDGSRCG